ncbi:MAG: integron [Hyphomicrobiaceae bacterium]
MPRRVHVVVSVALCAMLPIASALAESRKKVRVGGERNLDACGGVGVVVGLNPKGDNFLAVRSGPGSRYKMRDKLREGQMYFDCDAHGKWIGIVYSRNPNATCGVTSPIAKRQAYRGPCKSGWIFRKYTKLIAG